MHLPARHCLLSPSTRTGRLAEGKQTRGEKAELCQSDTGEDGEKDEGEEDDGECTPCIRCALLEDIFEPKPQCSSSNGHLRQAPKTIPNTSIIKWQTLQHK